MAVRSKFEIKEIRGASGCRIVVLPDRQVHICERSKGWVAAGTSVALGATPDEAGEELLRQYEDLRAGAQR